MKHLQLFEKFLSEGKRKPVDPDAFKREDMANLFGKPEDVSFAQDFVRIKALLWIYKFQTEDEKRSDSTHVLNGVGFTGTDAEILSSFSKQLINKGWLSPKQMTIVRKKIKKYENQMAKISTAIKKGDAKKDEKIDEIMKKWAKENAAKYQQQRIPFPADSVKESLFLFEDHSSKEGSGPYIIVDEDNQVYRTDTLTPETKAMAEDGLVSIVRVEDLMTYFEAEWHDLTQWEY